MLLGLSAWRSAGPKLVTPYGIPYWSPGAWKNPYSERGRFMSYGSFLERFRAITPFCTDTTHIKYLFHKNSLFVADSSMYNLWWCLSLTAGLTVGLLWRTIFCDPCIAVRHSDRNKLNADRDRLWAFGSPFTNYWIRNAASKYRSTVIDNEPDYADACPSGARPERIQTDCRGTYLAWILPRDFATDKLYHKTTTKAIRNMYQELEYSEL